MIWADFARKTIFEAVHNGHYHAPKWLTSALIGDHGGLMLVTHTIT